LNTTYVPTHDAPELYCIILCIILCPGKDTI
jgi:hypothetical protein